MAIFIATAAGIVTIAIGATGCVRWIYKRGQASGKAQAALEAERVAQIEAQARAQAKVEALEAQVAQIQAELDSMRAPQAKITS
jgi:uncharacterized protein YlxW (UPF0749 family)